MRGGGGGGRVGEGEGRGGGGGGEGWERERGGGRGTGRGGWRREVRDTFARSYGSSMAAAQLTSSLRSAVQGSWPAGTWSPVCRLL